MKHDNREYGRAPLTTSVKFFDWDRVGAADAIEISGSGIFLKTQVLLGEGSAPWKQIFDAAEKKGGVQYYLIEQEGSALSPIETVERCLQNYKKIHG